MKRVIQINLSNKVFYSLMTLSLILLIGIAYAYGTNEPINFGHSANEIENLPTTKIVLHSQSTDTPLCPSGWNKLWEGYSYAGGYIGAGLPSGQLLGDTGSCLENFTSMPFIGCSANDGQCMYDVHDFTMWLSASGADSGFLAGEENILPYISRCSVCEKPASVLVKHSMTNSTPDCPEGWTELWEGYSYQGSYLSINYESGQLLGDTGSCLKTFFPIPFVECPNSAACDYFTAADYSIWMIAKNTQPLAGETFLLSNYQENIQPYIGKCRVCSK
jgi:integrin beta 8